MHAVRAVRLFDGVADEVAEQPVVLVDDGRIVAIHRGGQIPADLEVIDPGDVPHVAVEYVAEQVGVADPSCIKSHPERLPTQHEHAREIRGLLGYREFADAEAEVRTFVASRAAQTRDSRRELFNRAVLWLNGGRVLLPGITTLAPLITSVRAEQLAAINDHLVEQTPLEMRRELLDTLVVPEGKKPSGPRPARRRTPR